MATSEDRPAERPRRAWAGGLIGIGAGLGATVGLLVAGGEGLALGAAFGAAAGVVGAAAVQGWGRRG